MKNKLTLFCLCMVLLATSCVKNNNVSPNLTVVTTVNSNKWTSTDGGKTWSVNVSVPELDSYYHDRGAVLLYASFVNGVYEQIPEVYGGIAYSFSHRVGSIEIDIQSSNGTSVISPPGSIGAKIVMVDSK